jgi:uncharacterized protein (TIGR03435 family)
LTRLFTVAAFGTLAAVTASSQLLLETQTPAAPQGQSESQAQSAPRRKFEVASIRPDPAGQGPTQVSDPLLYLPGGRFTAIGVTLVDVLVRVYPTRRIQMKGGPAWMDSARFDIVAKADEGDGPVKPGQFQEMVQMLLEDRFKLTMHHETKEMSVFALVVGKDPPKLQQPKEGEKTGVVPGPRGQLSFQQMSMAGLVNTISNILHTPFVDATGIKERFDCTLDPLQFVNPDVPWTRDTYGELTLTAVQEQLGFKIDQRKQPLVITVIDRAEMPSQN